MLFAFVSFCLCVFFIPQRRLASRRSFGILRRSHLGVSSLEFNYLDLSNYTRYLNESSWFVPLSSVSGRQKAAECEGKAFPKINHFE